MLDARQRLEAVARLVTSTGEVVRARALADVLEMAVWTVPTGEAAARGLDVPSLLGRLAAAERARDEATRYRDYAFQERDAARTALEITRNDLTRAESERDTIKAQAKALARESKEAREALARMTKASLPVEHVLQCLKGVHNDITSGHVVLRPDADKFHRWATERIRAPAGLPLAEPQSQS